MTADRRMFRYVVPVDDQPHVVPLSHGPVAVAAIGPHLASVEFWAEHTEGAPQARRAFRVFGTGHPLPEGAKWVGTCPRLPSGIVWHLYELPAGGL
jgi:hypothetical protein